jgi:hypothetical protein
MIKKMQAKEASYEVEGVVVSMFNTQEGKYVKIMKFKSETDKLLICALVDSDSTHSFVHSFVLQDNKPQIN